MRYLLVFIQIMVVSGLLAQNTKLVDQALEAYKKGDIQEAQTYIDEALLDGENNTNPKVWNFKGHIYKQLYKEAVELNSSERDVAVEAFKKSSELAPSSKFHTDNVKALEYLSATYFNDAVKGAISVRYNSNEDPVVHFQKFKEIRMWMNPEADIGREELEFLKMMAQGYEKIHVKDDSGNRIYMDKAVEYYEQALLLDQSDYESNFNLAIVYYNEGAALISQISYKTGFSELMDIQKRCVEFFKKALPHMEKAESIRPNRIETLKGLMFINRALNNFDAYLSYKVQLEKILKK